MSHHKTWVEMRFYVVDSSFNLLDASMFDQSL